MKNRTLFILIILFGCEKIKKKQSNKNNFIDGEFEDIENDDERKI